MKILRLLLPILLIALAACAEDNEVDREILDDETVSEVEDDSGLLEDNEMNDDSSFNIVVSGEAAASLTTDNAVYGFDYEEPGSGTMRGTNPTDSISGAEITGLYSILFEGEGDEAQVEVIFSDYVEGGATYIANAPIQEDEPSLIISLSVIVGNETFSAVEEGEITFDVFGDNRISGSFDFVLTGETGEIDVEGTFTQLPFETNPTEALDDVIEGEPRDNVGEDDVGAEPGQGDEAAGADDSQPAMDNPNIADDLIPDEELSGEDTDEE
jgi:hypothetical protein